MRSMRTTISIHDQAFKLCKKKAEEKGVSIGEVVTEAIFLAYREKPGRVRARRYDLPVSGQGGLRPGVDLDNTAALKDVMEGRA